MTLQRDPARSGIPAGVPGGSGVGAADATWLELRRGADTLARDEGAGVLLERLVAHLEADRATGPQVTSAGALRVVDIGAGTGANRGYLAPRLPMAQEWVAVDHDPELLAHPGHGPGPARPARAPRSARGDDLGRGGGGDGGCGGASR